MPVSDQSDRIELLQHLGASVGLQLTSPRILFVEGRSDAELLPCFLGSLPASVSIVDTGGKANLMRLTHSTSLLDEVIKEGRFFFIRDKDVEDDPQALDAVADTYGDRFFVWDRYHIENYLLDEEAIYQVLANDPDLPTPESACEIGSQLRALADEHRKNVLAKHLESKLNRQLRERLKLNVPDGVRESLLKAAAARWSRTERLLSETEIEQLFATEKRDLEDRWDTEWKDLCVGRDILKAYWKQHVKRYYRYEIFRNKIARKIRELNRIPARITEVMNHVTAGLPDDADNDRSGEHTATAIRPE